MVARAETSAERIRRAAGLGDGKAPRKALTEHEKRQVARIVGESLSKLEDTRRQALAMMIESVPAIVRNVVTIATGAKGDAKAQLAAADMVLTEVRRTAGGPLAGVLDGKGNRPLAELPLADLEALASSLVTKARELRANGAQKIVESPSALLPDSGSNAESDPDPAAPTGPTVPASDPPTASVFDQVS